MSDIGAATNGHTHTTTLATDLGTSTITLAHASKYKLTAGGSSIIFTMPSETAQIQTNWNATSGLAQILNKPTNLVTGTGTANQLTYWTAANTVGTLAVATYPSLTELSYVKGVTSAIQTQLNNKQATITGAATTIVSSDLTASMALVSDADGKVAASSISATKLGYLTDVTSNIQAQLSGKQATLTNPVTRTGTVTNKYLSYFSGASTITGDASLQFDSDTQALTVGSAAVK